MKFEHKEVIDGKTVVTTSTRFLFWHIITQYEAQERICHGYWTWLKLPNRDIVSDFQSFQLDAWNRR